MSVTAEELIVQRTQDNLFLMKFLFIFADILIFQSLIAGALTRFPWIDRKYHAILRLGITLFKIVLLLYMPYPFVPIESLYTARSDASKCLDLLRLETMKDPIRTSYSLTYRSCAFVFRVNLSELEVAEHAAAVERWVNFFAERVAAPHFMGDLYTSGRSGDVEAVYASLHCTKSWAGIARWITTLQLGESIGNSTQNTAPSDATPVHRLQHEL